MRNRKEIFVVVGSALAALAVVFSVNHVLGHHATADFRYRYAPPDGRSRGDQIRFYEKGIAGHQGNALDRARLAELYFDEGRRTGDNAFLARAGDAARRSLAELPSPNPGAKAVLAKVAAARHQFGESIRLAHEILKESPDSEPALAALATAYLGTGELSQAAQCADRLALAKPLMVNLALRGMVLLAQGREDEGVFEIKQALGREEPGQAVESAWTRALLGRHFFKRGQLELARSLFEEAIRISPDYSLALDLMGQLEAKQRHFGRAESFFNQAYAISRETSHLLHLAEATERKGQKGAADALRAQVEDRIRRELAAGSYRHRLDLARVLLDKGIPGAADEAAALAEQESLARRNGETYYVLSLALASAGRMTEARAAIASALTSGGREPEYYYQASLVEQQAGDRERAAFYLEQVRRQDPFFEPPPVVRRAAANQQAR